MENENYTSFEAAEPRLTLDPVAEAGDTLSKAGSEENENIVELNENMLTDEQKAAVDDFVKKIDITDSAQIARYGAAAQQKVADFSDSALGNARTKDFGDTGDMIASLVSQLKDFDVSDERKGGGFFGLFRKARNSVDSLKTRYGKAEAGVNSIVESLEKQQVVLLKDIAMLDRMYDANLAYYRELTMYIVAGKKKLEEERATTAKALREKAEASGLPEDAQAAEDYEELCRRFEKKLYDLQLTRTICIQMAPQIRLIQNNDALMSEKIQSVIVSTIPLWKNQMVLALGISHSNQAMEAQRSVTDMTNELLRKNAETLRQGSVDIARESERGIVELETLQNTNQQLIATLSEVQKIQAEGRQKRAEAEKELGRIEGELRQKLLENT